MSTNAKQDSTCKNGCSRPVHAKNQCQACYRRERRRERGLKAPGPAPDPDAPYSRYNPEGNRSPSEVEGKEPVGRRVATETHCVNGHEFTEGTTYVYPEGTVNAGKKVCKICRRHAQQRYHGRPVQGDELDTPNGEKTHCPQGHEYTDDNVYLRKDGSRVCAACSASRARENRYGLSEEEYADLLSEQSHACAICSERMDPACVDHDHETGEVRGLLCSPCNTGLGLFRDDPELLRAAIAYLG